MLCYLFNTYVTFLKSAYLLYFTLLTNASNLKSTYLTYVYLPTLPKTYLPYLYEPTLTTYSPTNPILLTLHTLPICINLNNLPIYLPTYIPA